MNYSISNTLSKVKSLKGDGLALNLQFAADKTLTARKGPTPTFSRASTATYINSSGAIQSAAINVARFTHNPTTLVCEGLLMETSRTNLIFPSATLTTQTRTVVSGSAYTFSFYGTGTVVLSGAQVATVTGTGAYPTRTTLTFTAATSSLIMTVTGSVTQAQLERGSSASSYIPTTSGSVVRSSDICSISGSEFTGMYNEFAGTVFCELNLKEVTSPNTALFGVTQDGIAMQDYIGSPCLYGYISANENVYFNSNIGNVSSGISRKSAMAFENNGSAILCLNGSLGTQSNSVILPISSQDGITPTDLSLFFGQLTTIKSFQYYKKRLANAKLQTLTT